MKILSERCPTTKQKGKEHEQIQKVIAYDPALRVPHHLGAKIPVSGDAGKGERGSGVVRAGTESADELRGTGNERPSRSRTLDRAGTAQAGNIRIHGAAERQECDPGVRRVSGVEAAAVLGQSLLGAGLLCWDSGLGPRDDTEVCKMAREAGTTARGVPL